MKPITSIAALAAANIANATPVVVSYDTTYDNSSNSLTVVACSNGSTGIITRYGFQTIGEIPCYVASSYTIPGWNADTCGQCLSVDYNGTVLNFLAIDSKPNGLDIAEGAMNELTGGRAAEFGIVTAEMSAVDIEDCGLERVDPILT